VRLHAASCGFMRLQAASCGCMRLHAAHRGPFQADADIAVECLGEAVAIVWKREFAKTRVHPASLTTIACRTDNNPIIS